MACSDGERLRVLGPVFQMGVADGTSAGDGVEEARFLFFKCIDNAEWLAHT